MKKKGFTLVELLAVIVILAIILLITFPIVSSLLKSTKKSSSLKSAELYIRAVEQSMLEYRLNNSNFIADGTYNINTSGNLCLDEACEKILEISADNKPKSGIVVIKNENVSKVINLDVNDIIISTNNNGELDTIFRTIKYQNGEIVYFDVSKGQGCTKEEYESSFGLYETYNNGIIEVNDYGNSKSGYNGIDNKDDNQNSCLKFYAFNDDGGEKLNLILDHNTSISVWKNNKEGGGPAIALENLRNDTKNWNGTEVLTNYVYDVGTDCYKLDEYQQYCLSGISYTIDYSSFNARFITAQEVAVIVGYDSFDEKTAGRDYLPSGETARFKFSERGATTSQTSQEIGWLYDRLNYMGLNSGMPNLTINVNADDSADYLENGYWTATLIANATNLTWVVAAHGELRWTPSTIIEKGGIRPVIEVLKSKL